jgi:2,4-didehydro-3-deoxy-L-rhamnonate hydrolase
MRLCRFNNDRLGCVTADGQTVADVTAALDAVPPQTWPLAPGDPLIAHLDAVRTRIAALLPAAPTFRIDDIAVNSPVATPSKVIAAPNNYHKHVEEARADPGINFGSTVLTIEELGLFLKASSSLAGPFEGVELPALDRRMDHEIELALVIGKQGRDIPRAQALDYVACYTIGLDMTIRGREDRSWRKSFETFSVLGPWMVTADEIPDPGALDLSIKVNGEVRQHGNTRALIFDVPRLIERAASAYTLYPGDVIMTGTPEGVGSVSAGDVLECTVERIGTMQIKIRSR